MRYDGGPGGKRRSLLNKTRRRSQRGCTCTSGWYGARQQHFNGLSLIVASGAVNGGEEEVRKIALSRKSCGKGMIHPNARVTSAGSNPMEKMTRESEGGGATAGEGRRECDGRSG